MIEEKIEQVVEEKTPEIIIEEGVQESIEVNMEEPITPIEQPKEEPIKEPVIATGRIERKDIKEVKEQERGFSVRIPKNKSNNGIQRLDNNGFDVIITKK